MGKMGFIVALFLVSISSLTVIARAKGVRTESLSEDWGYVEVRPQAHMFWWLHQSPNKVEGSADPWPTVLWIQGGPGASGVAMGSFQEIGPLDLNLKPRNSTWLQVANLLFVDNPVGTGYSYVKDTNLLVKTDEDAGADLTSLLIDLFNRKESLRKSPLYLVGESYGGKFAVTCALSALKAIESGRLKAKFGGVALGNSWMSPLDFVKSWPPLLKDLSRLDDIGFQKSNSVTQKIKDQIESGLYLNATSSWIELEAVISDYSGSVSFYNFLLDRDTDSASSTTAELSEKILKRYERYLNSLRFDPGGDVDIDTFMNVVIRKKLNIIPPNITWGAQAGKVFDMLADDFMKPRIKEVDELLSRGVNVTVYTGQLDLICATKGTQAWIEQLKWEGLHGFQNTERRTLHCGNENGTAGFTKSFKNLQFYWILNAGHFVPVEQPCLALKMIHVITRLPAPLVVSSVP